MKKLKIAAFSLLLLSFSYSQAQIKDIVDAVKGKNSTGTMQESGGMIKINGNDQVKTVSMEGQKLDINGNDHQITINGFASSIIIHGTGNVVNGDIVNNININGVENKVYYRTSKNKNGKATSPVSGVDNAVIKRK